MSNINYDGKEYTLVESYNVDDGTILEYYSDNDIILFFLEKNGKIRNLTFEEDKDFREKYNLTDHGYVPANIKDLINGELSAEQVDKEKEEKFKNFFKSILARIDLSLVESPYINKRLDNLKYKSNANGNAYANNTVYFRAMDNWVVTHETVHGIVDKSTLTTMGIVEGITDNFVGMLLPNGNYSRNFQINGGKIQVNDAGQGQSHLVTLAKQLEFGLGSEYNIYEMLTSPHSQIKKFGQMYGLSKNRILLHKINKLYHDSTLENYNNVQEYMLELIFDKKLESVKNSETALKYFEDLQNFGLLRGRIEGKDDALKYYYNKQKELLRQKGIDLTNIPDYKEKPFYPCGDCYLKFNSFLKSSIKARSEGKGTCFQILYNEDNTCIYIIVDGVLNYIQNNSFNNKRLFNYNEINSSNSKIVPLGNDYYLITGPDGITETVRDTKSDEMIDAYFEKKGERKM